MISLIETLNYRCLRHVRQVLQRFHVLVGPNASGKTTFLDVMAFLSHLVSSGLEEAISQRTANFTELLWQHEGDRFELAIEARIPEERRRLQQDENFDTIRYEVALEIDSQSREVNIAAERGLLKTTHPRVPRQQMLFPWAAPPPGTILQKARARDVKTVFSKARGGNDNYYVHGKQDTYVPSFKLGPKKSTLGNLPEDELNHPVSTWLKEFLTQGVQQLVLNSLQIRMPSPPWQGMRFKPDGSNLPWVISSLEQNAGNRLRDWVCHLQTALPDLRGIRTEVRPEDRFRYLILQYSDGLEVPSWLASDGTLRLLALTLPAYLQNLQGVFLVEEPENGIHPRAVETMYQSLSSVYDAQILMATHSPVILSAAKPADVLCFGKTEQGATDIVLGSEHPELSDWRGEVDLGTLFASGVLG
jgi:predicted ATPase